MGRARRSSWCCRAAAAPGAGVRQQIGRRESARDHVPHSHGGLLPPRTHARCAKGRAEGRVRHSQQDEASCERSEEIKRCRCGRGIGVHFRVFQNRRKTAATGKSRKTAVFGRCRKGTIVGEMRRISAKWANFRRNTPKGPVFLLEYGILLIWHSPLTPARPRPPPPRPPAYARPAGDALHSCITLH